MLRCTISGIKGDYAPATLRAYFTDHSVFISICDLKNQRALPANVLIATILYVKSATREIIGQYSAGGGGAISAVHRLNRFTDSPRDPEVRTAMKRMRRTLGRSASQAYDFRQDMLNLLLANVGDSIRSLRDTALLQLAYDTLCRRSELVTLRMDDVVTAPQITVMHYSILLRKSKVDQEARGRYLPLGAKRCSR